MTASAVALLILIYLALACPLACALGRYLRGAS